MRYQDHTSSCRICRLCSASGCHYLGTGFGRRLFECPHCGLVFVPAEDHVSSQRERAEYDLHENRAESEGYVRYLSTVADELFAVPLENPTILDFGSCAEHVLTTILRGRGYHCDAYDPLYGLGLDGLSRESYSLVVLCEVIEHLRDLPAEIDLIGRLLAPGGFLLVRTELFALSEEVPTWRYANDVTHINFFSRQSLTILADMLGTVVHHCDGRRLTIIGPTR